MLTFKFSLCYNQFVAGNSDMEEYPSPVEGTGLENQEVA